MQEKSCLLLISGVTGSKPYFKDTISGNATLDSLLSYHYGKENIIEIDTNALRDSWTPDLLDKVSFTDITKFYLNGLRRRAIRSLIKATVDKLKAQGYTKIDLWAHSLGTVEAAGSKIDIDTFIMFGSPIGFPTPVLRSTVKNELSFLGITKPPLKCETLINFWSPLDIVGSRPLTRDTRWRFGASDYKDIRSDTQHDLSDYLEFFLKIRKKLGLIEA